MALATEFSHIFVDALGGSVQSRPTDDIKITFDDLWIRSDDRRLIPLVPKPAQADWLDRVCPGWRDHDYTVRGLREDILKARQLGMSTMIEALYFIDTYNNPLTETIIIAHDKDLTARIFAMVHRFYAHLPEKKKRPLKRANKYELLFEDIDSGMYVVTAGTRHGGRGTTTNNIHMSERAFWGDIGDEVEGAIMGQAREWTNVIRETTANGLNEYYDQYQDNKAGRGGYHAVFYSWPWEPAYRRDASAFEPTAKELQLMETYSLEPEQMAWYRWKEKEQKRKRGASMKQEFPFNDKECFVSSLSNAVFNREYLGNLIARLETREPLMSFEPGERPYRGYPALTGYLRVFSQPVRGHIYVIACDPSEGIDDRGDHDEASFDVVDIDTWEQVATYEGLAEPHEFARDIASLGELYNWAEVAVMRLNHGHAVHEALIHTHEYGNLYRHQELDAPNQAETTVPLLGFPENPKTKGQMIGKMQGTINDLAEAAELAEEYHIGVNDFFVINDRTTAEQLFRYVKKPGGSMGAEKGHDDKVTSICLAHYLCQLRSVRSGTIQKQREPDNRYSVGAGR